MDPIEERLAALEARVAELEGTRRQTPDARRPTPHAATPRPPIDWDKLIQNGEGMLGRAGIGLLVVGLILLFRYAVERDWITPELRVVIGLVVGAALLGGGFFRFSERRLYRQILMGGGIVVLFITGLAASELYHFISPSGALAYFVVVAAIGFMIAAQQNEPVIASITAMGAILPPAGFIGVGNSAGTAYFFYQAVVIGWSATLATMRGWERTLAISSVAGLFALLLPPLPEARLAKTIAITAAWLSCAAFPLFREKLSRVLLLSIPIIVTLALGAIVDAHVLKHMDGFQISTALDAIGFAAIALVLKRSRDESLFAAFAAAAASAAATVEDPGWPLAIAVVALIAVFVRIDLLRNLANVLMAIAAVAFLSTLNQIKRQSAFDGHALTFIGVTAIALVIGLKATKRQERVAYLVSAYVAVLLLLATELSAVKAAPWLASVSYGLLGSALLMSGRMRNVMTLQRTGMLTLALLIGRLFMYDLVNVAVGVRIVLFMACGFAFLGLSYLLKPSHKIVT
ncbi:MAG TPA: DUF2339 domain-containing protein [Longimicrobiales bacterium]|nr:DUF2339 domain-containing protein [Longimicrobiales bacterium]